MSAKDDHDPAEPPGPRGTWMISFVDLISVLLTFMVMIYAMSDAREIPASQGTDRLSETVDWHRQLPARGARNGAEAGRDQPALDLDYLQGVLEAALADEPVRPAIFRRDGRLIIALPPPAAPFMDPGVQRVPLGDAEQRLLHTLARPLNSVDNRLEIHGLTVAAESPGNGNADAAATPPPAAWVAGIERALAAAAALAEAGVQRPVGCYGLADLPSHGLGVGGEDPRQPPASRIHVVVLAGAGE